jgi:conjugal transfer/entry exclusion protein
MRKMLGLSVLVVALWSTPAAAQLAVFDAANFGENIITAIESVLTTIQTILIEANQILELTPLDDIATAGGIAEDMALLGQLAGEAQDLSYDIGSIQAQIDALFHLDSAPDTTNALKERLIEIRRIKYQCYSYAARVQTLLRTALRTVDHLQGLLDALASLVGNMQANQTHAQVSVVATKHLANLDVQIAAFHRAQTVDRLEEFLTIESLGRINDRVYER